MIKALNSFNYLTSSIQNDFAKDKGSILSAYLVELDTKASRMRSREHWVYSSSGDRVGNDPATRWVLVVILQILQEPTARVAGLWKTREYIRPKSRHSMKLYSSNFVRNREIIHAGRENVQNSRAKLLTT